MSGSPAGFPSRLPLTEGQAGIWYGQRLDTSKLAYAYAEFLDIEGPLDSELLREAVRRTFAEAEALSVSFGEDADGPWQRVGAVPNHPVPLVDLTDEADPWRAAREWMRARVHSPLDPAAGEVLRTAVLRLSPERHLWFWRLHHIVSDGVGSLLLVQRAAEVHGALAAGRAPAATPFGPLAALVEEDRRYRASAGFQEDRRYWLGVFDDLDRVPAFSDASLPPAGVALRETWYADPALRELLAAFARAHGVKWPRAMVAAFAAYTALVTGASEAVLGLPVSNRHTHAAATTPGMVSNIVPLRVACSPGDSFLDLLARVSATIDETRAHRRHRFEDIRRDLRTRRGTARVFGPTANVMSLGTPLSFDGCPARLGNLAPGPIEDFMLGVYATPEELTFTLDANPGLYEAAELAGHRTRFDAFLRQVLAGAGRPLGEIGVLGDEERRALIRVRPRRPESSGGPPTLVAAFEERARLGPAATAVTCGSEALTYGELNARANRLARLLLRRGCGPDRLVAVRLPPSVDLAVALLAVLKAGAAYVPVDPEHPPERVESLLADAKPSLLIDATAHAAPPTPLPGPAVLATDAGDTLAALAALPPDDLRPEELGRRLTRDDAAYVIHTSGSTGRPKGVVVPHGNVLDLFSASRELFDLRADDVWSMAHSFSFDFSVWELWGPLLHGGRLVLVPPAVRRAPERFLRLLVDEAVTVLSQTPSAFQQLLQAYADDPPLGRRLALRYVVFGGEALDFRQPAQWYALHPSDEPVLVNMYGITETTVHASHLALDRSRTAGRSGSLIGRGLPGLALYVLDERLRPVPDGVTGEVYVAGAQLARGYLNLPGLTATRFVADPFGPPGSRMYRSGDLARRTAEGLLRYEGRADDQVKVRGFRIELGEIEAELRACPAVADCRVVVRRDAVGDSVLAAYVVPTGPADPDTAGLRRRLARRLPSHMVPATVTAIDRVPLTSNGKLDRRALPDPVVTGGRDDTAATPTERIVLDAFRTVLAVADLSVRDDFFDLGGDSFKAVRVARAVGRGTEVLDVFQHPTPQRLARRIQELHDTGGRRLLRPLTKGADASTERTPTLVCVPYGGGTAAAYHRLAAELNPGIATWSAALPGHDPTHAGEPLLGLDETADLIAAEILDAVDGPFAVYGHCAGSALAVAVAQRVERQGRRPAAVFIGAALPSAAPVPELERARDWPADSLYAHMKSLGGFDGVLDETDLRTVLAVLRHDMTQGLRFQVEAEEGRHRLLDTPLVVVIGDDDAATRGYAHAYTDWKRYAAHVELAEIPGGGHYFVTHRPRELAAVISERLGASRRPGGPDEEI
ncbi:amino acid adenylation domain-containing protein [Streptomyces sp. NPDC002132]|uniref:amino acid adenylation domain-containing protein n=1 Tax=unclassified Streptomyces TaxID=2593676 RepID=UPI0033295D2D